MSGGTKRVAEWLCDSFGDDDEDVTNWVPDAMDLFDYLSAHGYIVVQRKPNKNKTLVSYTHQGEPF